MHNTEELLYYNFIMGKSDNSMNTIFHRKWIEFLDGLDIPYRNAIQLRIGNHLRPLLVYWGAAIGAESIDAICVDAATEMAICVEIMHKTSIIIDDLIDSDEKRHNRAAFHKQYSSGEAIIFAIYFLGESFYKINELSSRYPALNNFSTKIFSKTLCLMANGCLQELTLTSDSRYNIENISKIISMETSTLIKNSALLGFLISRTPNDAQIELLNNIGDKVGYLFQAMNDLEPFSSFENISLHKGNFNIVQKDLKNIEDQVELLINQLSNQQINQQCLDEFYIFFTEIMKIAKEKLFTYNPTEID